MLAVLKKRWKPKRASVDSGERQQGAQQHGRRAVRSLILEPTSLQLEAGAEKVRVSVSPRQVHPELCQAPNICVQGGRIEFVRAGQPTAADHLKDKLEARISELEDQLEEERRTTLRERRNTARLQGLLQERESVARDAEVEREQAELRLAETKQEAARATQEAMQRLEESLRSMSLYKNMYLQLKSENIALAENMEERSSELESENKRLRAEILELKQVVEAERVVRTQVERENGRLAAQRDQCELCLDQVAHQVVQALLSQKGLREEISGLRDRVKELEKQNRTLTALLLNRLPSPSTQFAGATGTIGCVWRDRPSSLELTSPTPATTSESQGKDEGYSTLSSEVVGGSLGRRSASEPALSASEWWDFTDSTIGFDAPPELEEWAMDEIPGMNWLVEDEPWEVVSPGGDSWSSHGTTSEESKRSSTVSEGDCRVGTHFTSDFYRLVKFESSKSLASSSSRSQAESVCQQEGTPSHKPQPEEEHEPILPSVTPECSKDGRALLTVAEEEESLTSSLSTPETVVEEDAGGEMLAGLKERFGGSDEEPCQQQETEDSGCPTGWVHLATPPDLADPKLRADILDVVMLSRSSSSCSSEGSDDLSGYQHLHRLHRHRRHRKALGSRDAVRWSGSGRTSILGREDLFLRFGAKEQEAVASFDFLEEFTSPSSRESTLDPR